MALKFLFFINQFILCSLATERVLLNASLTFPLPLNYESQMSLRKVRCAGCTESEGESQAIFYFKPSFPFSLHFFGKLWMEPADPPSSAPSFASLRNLGEEAGALLIFKESNRWTLVPTLGTSWLNLP